MRFSNALRLPLFDDDDPIVVTRPGNPYKNLVVENTDNIYDIIGQDHVTSNFCRLQGHIVSVDSLQILLDSALTNPHKAGTMNP